MVVIVQYSVVLCSTLLIFEVAPQSEYGENYEQNLEYYEEPSDSEYYYGDYGDDVSEPTEQITTEEPPRARTVYPAVRPYSNGNRYAETPILTTSRPIPVRQPTGRGRRRDYNIRGYKDGWVEEGGRRQKLITTTTRRPVPTTTTTTYRTYPRTRRPIPTIASKSSESFQESRKSSGSENTKGEVLTSDDGGEYGNLLPYLGYRKEDRACPQGWVMDIYGYCRERFLMERRDWDWWWNIRDFYFGRMDSGYQSQYK